MEFRTVDKLQKQALKKSASDFTRLVFFAKLKFFIAVSLVDYFLKLPKHKPNLLLSNQLN